MKLLKTVGAAVYKIGTKRKKDDYQGTMQTPGIPDLCAFVMRATLPARSFRTCHGVAQALDRGKASRR